MSAKPPATSPSHHHYPSSHTTLLTDPSSILVARQLLLKFGALFGLGQKLVCFSTGLGVGKDFVNLLQAESELVSSVCLIRLVNRLTAWSPQSSDRSGRGRGSPKRQRSRRLHVRHATFQGKVILTYPAYATEGDRHAVRVDETSAGSNPGLQGDTLCPVLVR